MKGEKTGIIINESTALKHWVFLLEEWILLLKRYCHFMGDDAPYYYSERANIGVLAAAAWRAGWIALEEFGIRKHTKHKGRADLWFWPVDQEKEEYIEAKQKWKIPKNNDLFQQSMDDAEDVKLSRKIDALRIGLVFICPEISHKSRITLDDEILKLINFVKSVQSDALAWFFPDNYKTLKLNEFYYPGIILLAKVVKPK